MTTSIHENDPSSWRQTIRPALAFLISTGIGGALWAIEEHSHRAQMQLEIDVTAEQAGRRLSDWIGDRMNLSAYFAAKWEGDYADNPGRYERDAGQIVQMFPGYQAINWIDPDWVIRVVVPLEGNELVQDVNLHDYPLAEVREAVARAVETRQPTRTPAFIDLIQGGKGFATYWPIFEEDGRHAGFINAVFRVNELVETCLGRIELGQKFEVAIREPGGERIYPVDGDPSHSVASEAKAVEIEVLDQPWQLYLTPSAEFYAHHPFEKHHFLLPIAIFVGVLLAGLEHVLGRRKRALRTSQAQYQHLFDHAPVAYFSAWPNGVIEASNQVAESMTGYSKEILYRKSLFEFFITEADRTWVRQQIGQIGKGRSIAVDELRMRRSDGTLYWGLVSLEGMNDAEGALSLLRITVSDITERKEAEQARSRLSAAIEQAEEGMAITGAQGAIQYTNPAFHTINRHISEDCIGHSIDTIFPFGSGELDMMEAVRRALKKGSRWQGAYTLPQGGTESIQVEATLSPLYDDDGHLTSFVVIQRDVTHETELQNQLRQTHKMEAIGRLAGGIAHDFNNILQSLLGYASLARQNLADQHEVSHCLKEIEQSGRRATELVAHILAFGQKTDQTRQSLKVRPIVDEVLGLLQGSLSPAIHVETDFGSEQRAIVANPTQLHQIIMNLASNACHAMGSEGGTLRVGLHLVCVDSEKADSTSGLMPGEYMCLSVEDTGIGMSERVRERIFEPYFTTRDQGSGSGLGLAMVHGLVEQHRGAIQVESVVGQGTTFRIYFPTQPGAERDDALVSVSLPSDKDSSEEPIILQGERGRKPRARILFVDDEAPIVDSMSRILKCFGFEVTGYSDSMAAADAFREDPLAVDVVITDLSMPTLNGIELARLITELREDVPVILCSGYGATLGEEIENNSQMIKVFLDKPVSGIRLREAIEHVIDAQCPRS